MVQYVVRRYFIIGYHNHLLYTVFTSCIRRFSFVVDIHRSVGIKFYIPINTQLLVLLGGPPVEHSFAKSTFGTFWWEMGGGHFLIRLAKSIANQG